MAVHQQLSAVVAKCWWMLYIAPADILRGGKMDEFKSDIPGVLWDASRNRWRAYSAGPKRTRMFLGTRKTKEEAEKLRLDADAGRFPSAQEKHSALLDKMARIRMRAVWREVTKHDSHEWESFDHFLLSVGDRPREERKLVKKAEGRPFGPENFQWVKPKFDFMTSSGRRSYSKERYASDPSYYRRAELQRKFGISLEDYNVILEEQGGVCAICSQPETAIRMGRVLPLSVDHNHRTGAVRGLLCTACNIGLGSLAESKVRLNAAIAYLDKWQARETEPLPDNVVPLKRD
jgi:hypothetical protein